MSKRHRYPELNIHGKNGLARMIMGKDLPYPAALALVNDVLKNFDRYWHDSKSSQPEKKKYVRSAIGTPLDKLLKRINSRILAPHDRLIPDFIFGGLAERNHLQAAQSLLGKRRGRRLLGLDITSFFEQIKQERVFYLFHEKCRCSVPASRLLARLCCVPIGAKGSDGTTKSLARGFATSSRLAVWCNLDTFLRLKWKAKEKLRDFDPEIAVFVDDIGITASRVSEEQIETVSKMAEDILLNFDRNQPLPLNQSKKKNKAFADGVEHLGTKLGRKKLAMGSKTRSKRDKVLRDLKLVKSPEEKKELIKKKRAYHRYQRQIATQ